MRERKGRGAHDRGGKAGGAVIITTNKTQKNMCLYQHLCVCGGGGVVTNHKIPCPPALWISVRLGSNAF